MVANVAASTVVVASTCAEHGFWSTAQHLVTATCALLRDATLFALYHRGTYIPSNPRRGWTADLEALRGAFISVFPQHASFLPPQDVTSVVAAAAWLASVVMVLAFAIKGLAIAMRSMYGRSRVEVLFFPNKDGGHVARICRDVASARRRVWLAMFTLTHDDLSNELLRAHARGIDVRIIADDDQSNCDGADVARLSEAGVPVTLDCSRARMHHKFVVLDGQVLSGSFNWTRQASRANFENLCVLRDSGAVSAFATEFSKLWGEFGDKGGRLKTARRPHAGRRAATPPPRAAAA